VPAPQGFLKLFRGGGALETPQAALRGERYALVGIRRHSWATVAYEMLAIWPSRLQIASKGGKSLGSRR